MFIDCNLQQAYDMIIAQQNVTIIYGLPSSTSITYIIIMIVLKYKQPTNLMLIFTSTSIRYVTGNTIDIIQPTHSREINS